MKKTFIKLITFVIFIIIIFGAVFFYQISFKPNFEGEKEFVVKKGESVGQVSQDLANSGLIKYPGAFKLYLYLRGWQTSVQAGDYILTPVNAISLAEILVAGKVDNEKTLTIIEGWTASDVADYLVKEKIIIQRDDFLNQTREAKKWSAENQILQDSGAINLEGFLFPDTYRVYKDAVISDIVAKMLNNFSDKFTSALLTEIRAQGKNFYDVLKMASIIEAEVIGDEDRKIAAGILWKRLASNMPLQVDSSLKYVIGKKDNPSLTLAELKIDSSYNTYKYRGLPPTPIGNPGLSAIRASVYPKNSDYWFYLTDKEGKTIFSKTLDEHNAAIKKYLK